MLFLSPCLPAANCLSANCLDIWIMSPHPSVVRCERQLCTLHFYCDMKKIFYDSIWISATKDSWKQGHFETTYAGGKVAQTDFLLGNMAWDRSVLQESKEPRQSIEAHDHHTWTHELLHSASCPSSSSRVKCKGKTASPKSALVPWASCFLSLSFPYTN